MNEYLRGVFQFASLPMVTDLMRGWSTTVAFRLSADGEWFVFRVLVSLPSSAATATVVESLQSRALPQGAYVEVASADGEDVGELDVRMVAMPSLGGDAHLVLVLDEDRLAPDRGGAVVLWDDSVEEITQAVLTAAAGGMWISERVWQRLTANSPMAMDVRSRLTPLEQDTLRMVAHGMTDQEIGAARTVSVTTVRHHLRNLRSKLGCASRNRLIAVAYCTGIASPWSSLKTVVGDGAAPDV